LVNNASNSAAIVNGIGTDFDMVRLGITMYGVAPSNEVNLTNFNYKPALSIYSTITYIKRKTERIKAADYFNVA